MAKLFFISLDTEATHCRCPPKIGILKKFAKLTGKLSAQEFLFVTVAGDRPAILLRSDSAQVLHVDFSHRSRRSERKCLELSANVIFSILNFLT